MPEPTQKPDLMKALLGYGSQGIQALGQLNTLYPEGVPNSAMLPDVLRLMAQSNANLPPTFWETLLRRPEKPVQFPQTF